MRNTLLGPLDADCDVPPKAAANSHSRLESNIWIAVDRVLKPELQRDLRAKIQKWHENHPNQRYAGATRLWELAAAFGGTSQSASSGPNNVFRMLYLDPWAGLDPTATAIQETRRVAERTMYYVQRMPTLLNWQVALLALELAQQPETKQVLADAERLTRSAESFAKVADQLPQLVNDQRQAAIQQVFDGLASQENKGREVLGEARQTLDSAREMATAVNTAVQSLDAFVRSVKPPATTNEVEAAGGSTRRPFDVLDYGQAAAQVGTAAQQLNTLVATVNQTIPEINGLLQRTGLQSKELMDYAFRRALLLVALTLAGVVLALLAYRRLASRVSPSSNKGNPQ